MSVSNEKSIRKNAIYNVIKTCVSIIFPLITFPYVTRTLSSESYGIYTFSQSIISYVTLLAGLGISTYARREGARVRENYDSLHEFANEVFSINVLSTSLSFLILMGAVCFWEKLFPYKPVILILSLSVAFTTFGADWVNIIFEDYGYITKRTIATHFLSLIIMFLVVRKPNDVIPYAFVSVSGTVVANCLNFIYIRKIIGIRLKFVINKKLIRHFRPILVLFMSSIVTVIYINSDVTILGILKSNTDVATYGAASKIYSIIKQMINSIAAVTIPRISLHVLKEKYADIKKIISETLETVLVLIVPIAIGLAILSKPIIIIISGDKYVEAVAPLVVLSISLVFSALGNIYVNTILIPFKKENESFVVLAISAIINIVFNFILIPEYSYTAAAITTIISEAFVMISSMIISRRIIRIGILRQVFLSAIGGVIVAVFCFLSYKIFSNYFLIVLFSVLGSVIVYFAFLCIDKNNIVSRLYVPMLKRKLFK